MEEKEGSSEEAKKAEQPSKPTKTGNQKLFIGLIVGVLVGAIFALHGLELLPGGYKYAAAVMIGAFFIVIILFLLTVIFRDRIVKAVFGEVEDLDSFYSDTKELIGSTAEAISDHVTKPFPEQHRKRVRQVAPRLANYLIWGRVRSWWFNLLLTVFLAIGGLATTVLLVNQNKLLETQNRKIDIQNALAEGQRRSSLVLLMDNVLTDLSKEIDEQKKGISKDSILILDSIGYSLSAPLIGRVSSLTQGFLPYQMLVRGNLTEEEYSPERAQLLLALIGSNLYPTTFRSVYLKASFSKSYLVESKLRGADLRSADLRYTDLTGANLMSANLMGADLIDADLTRADLTNADLIDADLTRADLIDADLTRANLTGANLMGANLTGANLMGTILTGADLAYADLTGAILGDADFTDANLKDANLKDAILAPSNLTSVDLIHTNFSHAYLKNAILRFTDLTGANLMGTILTGADLAYADLTGADLTKEQLFSCQSLYKATGINQWLRELEKERPCLFTPDGCSLN